MCLLNLFGSLNFLQMIQNEYWYFSWDLVVLEVSLDWLVGSMAKTVSWNTKVFLNLKTDLKVCFCFILTKRESSVEVSSQAPVVKLLPLFNRVSGVCLQTEWSFLWMRVVGRGCREELQSSVLHLPATWCISEFCYLTTYSAFCYSSFYSTAIQLRIC